MVSEVVVPKLDFRLCLARSLTEGRPSTNVSCMNEATIAPGAGREGLPESEFGTLVFDETIRRALRQTPQARLEMLRASLRDAEKRGMIPKRDRAAHEKRLLKAISTKQN